MNVRRTFAALGCAALCAAVGAAPAQAGSQVVTGEDEHCSASDTAPSICETTYGYIEYARAQSPNPDAALLVIDDCDEGNRGGGGDQDFIVGAYQVKGENPPPFSVICRSGPEYEDRVFSTAAYSAIVIGNGAADNQALVGRKDDFKRYFDNGGGIVTFNASSNNEDADENYLPLDVQVLDESFSDPYVVTPAGAAALKITDEQVNEEYSQHESFADPAEGSLLKVGVRAAPEGDEPGAAIVLFGRTARDEDDDDDDDDDEPVVEAPAPQQAPQGLPDPLTFTAFTAGGSVKMSSTGLVTIPGMTETCGVGPCQANERLYDMRGRAASHADDKRHGLLGRDADAVASGQSHAVRIRLTRSAARQLRRRARMRVEALVTMVDARGQSQMVRKTFTIRR